jgi:hypothetical protein
MKTNREHEKPGIKEYEDIWTGKASSRLHRKSPRALKKIHFRRQGSPFYPLAVG